MRVQTLLSISNSAKLNSYITHVSIVVIAVVDFLGVRKLQNPQVRGEKNEIGTAVMWNPSISS
jgi:hypothetical protein